MPIVATPLEAAAAASTFPVSDLVFLVSDLSRTVAFITAGMPAYYLTVRASCNSEEGQSLLWRIQGESRSRCMFGIALTFTRQLRAGK
jgi:hypothetical protein